MDSADHSYTMNNGNLEDFTVGDNSNHNGIHAFDGYIDEFRVSDIERSSSWLATSYNTMNDPSSFLSFGPEKPGP